MQRLPQIQKYTLKHNYGHWLIFGKKLIYYTISIEKNKFQNPFVIFLLVSLNFNHNGIAFFFESHLALD
jgi:hypothetical protein